MMKAISHLVALVAQLALLSYVCYFIYVNSLSNDWAFDDYLAIYNNKDVAEDANYLNLWRNDIWGKSLLAHDSHRSFRPLLVVVFKLLRSVYGLTPSAFRVVSICSHLIVTVLLYYVGNIVIGSPYISFGACMLFLTHPVHVESVAAVVNMAEPMCAIFILIAFIMYRKSADSFSNENEWNNKKGGILNGVKMVFRLVCYSVVSFFCISIASLVKETGITIAGVIVGSGCVAITVEFINHYMTSNSAPNINGTAEVIARRVCTQSHSGSSSRIYIHLYWIVFAFFCVFMYLVMRIIVVAYDPVDFILSVPVLYTLYSTFAWASTLFLVILSAFIQVLDRFGFLSFFKAKFGLNVRNILLFIKNLAYSFEIHSVDTVTKHSSSITVHDIVVTICSYTYPPLLSYIPLIQIPNTDIEVKSFYLGNSGLLRKAENPFATLVGYEKLYSLCYLHFRYLYQLVYPIRLVAEYSYNCIPKVESLSDERMVYVVSMYIGLLVLILVGIWWLFYIENDKRLANYRSPDESVETRKGSETFVNESSKFELDINHTSSTSGISSYLDDSVQGTETTKVVVNPVLKSVLKPSGAGEDSESMNTTASEGPDSHAATVRPDSDSKRVSFDFTEIKERKMKKDAPKHVEKEFLAVPKQEEVSFVNEKEEFTEIDCHQPVTPNTHHFPDSTPLGWYIHNDALLHGIMWLIIPFIPASGVFLKLGTLLAERLLYMPSIGYCWLLSMGIYIICRYTFVPLEYIYVTFIGNNNEGTNSESITPTAPHDARNKSNSCTKSKVKKTLRQKYRFSENMAKICYCTIICCISYWYGMLTIARNPAWKNDHTLHMDTLKSCPNSAKSNLQNARIYMGNGDMARTRYHINRAKEIDPDFCDIGYQEALLNIMTDPDPMKGLVVAANNLHCVFTNMQSMELINKVFQNQLQQMPNDFRILENWGDILSIPALYGSAAQKYLNAITDAMQKHQYEKAMSISLKAERSIAYFYNQSATATADDFEAAEANRHVLDDLTCQIYSVGGRIRMQILELIEIGEYKMPTRRISTSKGVGHLMIAPYTMEYQLSRYRTLLFQALQPKCVVVDPTNSKIVSNGAVSVMETLLHIVRDDFGGVYDGEESVSSRDAQSTLNYALFTQTLFHTMNKMRMFAEKPKKLKKKSRNYQQEMLAYEQQQEALYLQAVSYLKHSIKLYRHSADLFYFENQDPENALLWYNHMHDLNTTHPMEIPSNNLDTKLCHFGINPLNTVNKSCSSLRVSSNSELSVGTEEKMTISRMANILKVIQHGYTAREHKSVGSNSDTNARNTIDLEQNIPSDMKKKKSKGKREKVHKRKNKKNKPKKK